MTDALYVSFVKSVYFPLTGVEAGTPSSSTQSFKLRYFSRLFFNISAYTFHDTSHNAV